MSYRVKLDIFEGPFDLLVHLIENAKMDIYNIEISEITSQYVAYIGEMERLNIEVATEFMVLAANLMDIKSKMLLPKINNRGEVEEDYDPRDELVERLLEYKRFKAAATIFENLEEENLDVFIKPQEDISIYLDNPDEELNIDTPQFIKAFKIFLTKKEKIKDIKSRYEMVPKRGVSMEDRIEFIRKILNKKAGDWMDFYDTLDEDFENYSKAVSFVSILELAKEGRLNINQERIFGNIKLKNKEGGLESGK